MLGGLAAEIIKCPFCGGREVEIHSPLRFDAIVFCYECGSKLWTLANFLEHLHAVVSAATEKAGGVRGVVLCRH